MISENYAPIPLGKINQLVWSTQSSSCHSYVYLSMRPYQTHLFSVFLVIICWCCKSASTCWAALSSCPCSKNAQSVFKLGFWQHRILLHWTLFSALTCWYLCSSWSSVAWTTYFFNVYFQIPAPVWEYLLSVSSAQILTSSNWILIILLLWQFLEDKCPLYHMCRSF